MPYLNPDLTKQVKKELNARYPEFKFSARTVDNMSMVVKILAGPIDLLKDTDKDHQDINLFHLEFYEDYPEKYEMLKDIKGLMQGEQKEIVYDMDYGSVPNYYTRLKIGDYETPYKVKN